MRKRNRWTIAILAALMLVCMGACAQQDAVSASFAAGVADSVQFGESIVVEEYIVPVDGADYTLIVRDETNAETAVTGAVWKPEKPGTYTLVYTVTKGKSSDSAEMTLTVLAPELVVSYNAAGTQIYDYQSTVGFEALIGKMDFMVNSYYPYELYVKQVEVGGEIIDVREDTEYKIESYDDHVFVVACEAEDGQTKEVRVNVGVRYITEKAQAWMTENNVTASGYVNIKDDLTVTLPGAMLAGTGGNMTEFPYVAFNSDFTDGTFVELDFKGKGMPIVAFYLDQVTSSLTDGGKGIFMAAGWPNGVGEESYWWTSRYTVYGPNKSQAPVYFDGGGRIWNTGNNSPLGFASLDENTNYKLIVGTTNGVEWNGSTASITIHVRLVNLDTSTMVAEHVVKLDHVEQWCDLSSMTEGWFHGKIAIYSLTYYDTVFKMTLPRSGVNSLDEIMTLSPFKRAPQTRVKTGEPLLVEDYIVEPANDAEYTLSYAAEGGESVPVTGDTFTLPTAGTYELRYLIEDGKSILNTLTLTAIDDFAADDDLLARIPLSDGDFFTKKDEYLMEYSTDVYAPGSTESVHFYGDNSESTLLEWPVAIFRMPEEYSDMTGKALSFRVRYGDITNANMTIHLLTADGAMLATKDAFWQYGKASDDGWYEVVLDAKQFGDNVDNITSVRFCFDFTTTKESFGAGMKEIWLDNFYVLSPDVADEQQLPFKGTGITTGLNFDTAYVRPDSVSSVRIDYRGTSTVPYESFLGVDAVAIAAGNAGSDGAAKAETLKSGWSVESAADPTEAWKDAVLTAWIYNASDKALHIAPKLLRGSVSIGAWNAQPWLYTVCAPNAWTQIYVPLKDLGITEAFEFDVADYVILLTKSENFVQNEEYTFTMYVDGLDIVPYAQFSFLTKPLPAADDGDLLSTMQLTGGSFYDSSYRRFEYDETTHSDNSTESVKFSGSSTTTDAAGPVEQPAAVFAFPTAQNLTGKSLQFDVRFGEGTRAYAYLWMKTADGDWVACAKQYWQFGNTPLTDGWSRITVAASDFTGLDLTGVTEIKIGFDFVAKSDNTAAVKTIWLDNFIIQ